MADYFLRQRAAVMRGQRAASDLLDPEVWTPELASVLLPLLRDVSVASARRVARALGTGYDVPRTLAWLRVQAELIAAGITSTTLDGVDEALADPDDPPGALTRLFGVYATARAAQIAVSVVTELAAWGAGEALRQGQEQTGRQMTKTWHTTSTRPRPSHARVNGQTVPFRSRFSNGLRWPGDSRASADQRAGCRCEMDVGLDAATGG